MALAFGAIERGAGEPRAQELGFNSLESIEECDPESVLGRRRIRGLREAAGKRDCEERDPRGRD